MNTPPESLADFFTNDHRACDELWARFELLAKEGGPAAAAALQAFDQATRRHLRMEEEVLFPAFEEATGMSGGPSAVMRLEHQQMRGLLDLIGRAITTGDWEDALDQGDALLMFTQQHDQKEEAMLYPMAERVLGTAWPRMAEQISNTEA